MEIAVSLPFVAWAVYLHRSNWSNFAALKRSPSLNLLHCNLAFQIAQIISKNDKWDPFRELDSPL